MKRFIGLFILVIISIYAVGCGKIVETESSSTATDNSQITVNSSSESGPLYNTIQFHIDGNRQYIPENNTKSAEYNDAVSAYNDFLLRQAEEMLQWLNMGDAMASELKTAVKDLNSDGVPEMLTQINPPWYPYYVYTYRNGEVIQLAGPRTNGYHGSVGLLENNIYYSYHSTTGVEESYVSYNRDGSQTVEIFWYYTDEHPTSYTKYTVWREDDILNDNMTMICDIEYPATEDGLQQFKDKKAIFDNMDKDVINMCEFENVYSPFIPDLDLNYTPYIINIIEKNYK